MSHPAPTRAAQSACERFPVEIWEEIFLQLPDFESVDSLAAAARLLHGVCIGRREKIERCVAGRVAADIAKAHAGFRDLAIIKARRMFDEAVWMKPHLMLHPEWETAAVGNFLARWDRDNDARWALSRRDVRNLNDGVDTLRRLRLLLDEFRLRGLSDELDLAFPALQAVQAWCAYGFPDRNAFFRLLELDLAPVITSMAGFIFAAHGARGEFIARPGSRDLQDEVRLPSPFDKTRISGLAGFRGCGRYCQARMCRYRSGHVWLWQR
ncbi:hypothetical protein F5X99DRAFT_245059 [Biscogniauxia marginata]|nr:hypothetical protein F5X99DRAFT_245059 [Biscogniauxia marginata]